ncbi:hypothetical protein [Pseudalkalibacillus caeni]|uniref:Uncharacterized protein n=1 Tax=Exobacillus caeni TaxID=2574798 RepID=A0A5R9EYU9_9BACL|nr:hypothetical protein [Pseudalkalibacillus caeni]TLS36472.1 hypothetical protein FCL54_14735 [Pseudalkalibacillus caeni]
MLTNNELMQLEKKYFNIISEMIETHLGEILGQIYSHRNLVRTAVPGTRSNVFEKKVENVLESIISRQLGWYVSSTTMSSDSCYECGDAIIHIDAKTRTTATRSDTDARYNKITVEKNETSYDATTTLTQGAGTWDANLEHYVTHNITGRVPNLTYFFVMDYDEHDDIERLAFVCIPHGQFQPTFTNAILGAGRTIDGGVRSNIRFLINDIIAHPDHNWREKVCFLRR